MWMTQLSCEMCPWNHSPSLDTAMVARPSATLGYLLRAGLRLVRSLALSSGLRRRRLQLWMRRRPLLLLLLMAMLAVEDVILVVALELGDGMLRLS